MRSLFLLVVVGSLFPASPSQAIADEARSRPDTPWSQGVSPADRERALVLYRRGNQLFTEQKYARAAELYGSALQRWDHPAIRYNLGVSQLALGQTVEAFGNLRLGMAFGAAPLGKALHQRGLALLELLEPQVVELVLSCRVAGSVLSLNGQQLGSCPGRFTQFVEPGRHVVVARKPGFPPARSVVIQNGGSKRSLRVDVNALSIGADAVFAYPVRAVGDGIGLGGLLRLERRLSSSITLMARTGLLYRRPRFDEPAMQHLPLFAGIERVWDLSFLRLFVSLEVGGEVVRQRAGLESHYALGANGNLGAGVVFGDLELRLSVWGSRACDQCVLLAGSVGYSFAGL